MDRAKISEIFVSLQGEGPYAGLSQLFIRFYGCNLGCAYCDTPPGDFREYTVRELVKEAVSRKEHYWQIAVTGGEPLESVDFLKDFLPALRTRVKKEIYLETNGILYEELGEVIEYVDMISMDFKLPSSTGLRPFWQEHEKFLRAASSKKVFIKAVVTDATSIEDVIRMGDIISGIDPEIITVLQTASPINDALPPGDELLLNLKEALSKMLVCVRIMPQLHKLIGVR